MVAHLFVSSLEARPSPYRHQMNRFALCVEGPAIDYSPILSGQTALVSPVIKLLNSTAPLTAVNRSTILNRAALNSPTISWTEILSKALFESFGLNGNKFVSKRMASSFLFHFITLTTV